MVSLKLKTIVFLVVLGLVFSCCHARRKKNEKQLILQTRETNAVNFIRLLVMRLVYGIASSFGLGENISGVLNGAFVPPGVDDYDDYGDGLLDF